MTAGFQNKQNQQQYFYGSNIPGLRILEPRVSEQGMPLVYLAANPIIAALYTVHPVERPYYWYPFGFTGKTPVYTEYYSGALKDVYSDKMGYIYRCCCDAELLLDSPTPIGCALVSQKPVEVRGYTALPNVYEALLEYERAGKLIISRFETLSDSQKAFGEKMLTEEIRKYRLKENPDCNYSRFIRKRFAKIWEKA